MTVKSMGPVGWGSSALLPLAHGEQNQMPLELVEVPHLDHLRTEVDELKRIVYGKPNDIGITQAWAALDRVKETLSELCPNHPAIFHHR